MQKVTDYLSFVFRKLTPIIEIAESRHNLAPSSVPKRSALLWVPGNGGIWGLWGDCVSCKYML
jgi:hypothetical protein